MRVSTCAILVLAAGLFATPLVAQSDFDTSLHNTRAGKNFWYSAENGGFEAWTGVGMDELGCEDCHGPTDANGNPYDPWDGASCQDCHATMSGWTVEQSQCYSCHGRQATEAFKLGISDVHRDRGFQCWNCHTMDDLHGDGNEYDTMFREGAIDVDCLDCHNDTGVPLPDDHASYDPHGGKIHCSSCHTKTVISCYNCHFESVVEAHVKRAKQPISDFVILVNREKDDKVYPASFQSLTYEGTAFVAFGPYAAHTIMADGRTCSDCHNNMGGAVEAINQYNNTGKIQFATWDEDAKALSWIHGVVPLPIDYEETFKMDFITYDGDPADPPGPSSNWSSIGKDTWDGHQLFFATPLDRDQMAALGFGAPMPDIILDIKPGSCPNSVGVNSRGKLPVALLGSADFDVRDVDVSTLMLAGVPVLKYSYEDVAAPCDGGCCIGDDYDGYDDLNLKFDTPSILETIGDVDSAYEVELTLTGEFLDGTSFEASDTIVLRGQPNWRWSRERTKKTGRAQAIRGAN